MKYTVLFREGEIVKNVKNSKSPSKGSHNYSCFVPLDETSTEGILFISHECNDSNKVLGDGGGATVVNVKNINEVWITTGNYNNVDFSKVGNTFQNGEGFYTSKASFIISENSSLNNKEIYKRKKGIRDTSDFNGYKRWQNMGWMVEVDLYKKEATQKLYSMGRFAHGSGLLMPDSSTIYLTDNHAPSVFFKFIASTPNDFTRGQLYAYRQGDDGTTGSWIVLPMNRNSLLNAREVALKAGATIFLNMQSLCLVNNKIFISERGRGNFIHHPTTCFNGTLAHHIKIFKKYHNKYDYPNGGVLVFEPNTNIIRPLILGGSASKTSKFFSNPSNLASCTFNGKVFLVINEDDARSKIIEQKEGSGLQLYTSVCESWWLDLSINYPNVDDLFRFMIAPPGAKISGGSFTPDFKTYFVNIQHPSIKNRPPFNRSTTIAITGFNDRLIRKKNKP